MDFITNINGDIVADLLSGQKATIQKKELYTCSNDTLIKAINLASPAVSKPDAIANINGEIIPFLDATKEKFFNAGIKVDTNLGANVGVNNSRFGPVRSQASIDKERSDAIAAKQTAYESDLKGRISKEREAKIFEMNGGSWNRSQQILSGSDLCVFYMVEVPDEDDLARGIPIEFAKKHMIMLEFDSVLSISYSTIRERFPVRSLGYINPKAITNGIRTISGHIAFNIFAEDVLSRLRGRVVVEMEKKRDKIVGEGRTVQEGFADIAKQKNALVNDASLYNKTPLMNDNYKTMLLDQLPPFHLLVMGVNEYGIMSRMLIKDVSVIDENQYQGTQQPNIMNKVSFVARDIIPMTAKQYSSTTVTQSLSSMEEGYVGGNWKNGMTELSASSILGELSYDSVERTTKMEQ